MNTEQHISEAEFEVMKVIWKHAPINTNEVIKYMSERSDWGDATIRTLLNRLMKKGIVDYKKDGRVFVYTPKISEDEYRKGQEQSFLNKFYEGDINSLVLSFVKDENLSQDDIDSLYEMLKKKSKKK